MNSEADRMVAKISYEKPTAVDLGPTAGIVGASCAPGDQFTPAGGCFEVGNSAALECLGTGNSAGDGCTFGEGGTPGPG
jgi:hypothetical protein